MEKEREKREEEQGALRVVAYPYVPSLIGAELSEFHGRFTVWITKLLSLSAQQIIS